MIPGLGVPGSTREALAYRPPLAGLGRSALAYRPPRAALVSGPICPGLQAKGRLGVPAGD
jgi:hypothetical protein